MYAMWYDEGSFVWVSSSRDVVSTTFVLIDSVAKFLHNYD
jgi:hypothetical protein